MWVFNSILVAVLLAVLVAVSVWRAVLTARTPQGAVGWVVFLLAAPWFALPTYLIFGDHKYRGYVAARRASQRVIEQMGALGEAYRPPGPSDTRITPFEQIAGMPAVRGNGMELLIDGEATFEAILAAIDRAHSYICVQFYTIRDDTIGRAFQARLLAAAERGVSVRVIYDGVGSYALPQSYCDALEAAGARIVDPKAARGPTSRLQVNFRNHRKTVIVDGREGFIGGHNVGDEYMGRDPAFGRWRDTHIRIRGPIVTELQLVFAEDWHWATDEMLRDPLNWTATTDPADRTALIVPTGPGDEMDTGLMLFFSAIAVAETRVWIASPYFVPDAEILSALKHAALRGLDVRILLPDAIDHYLPWLAAFAYFDEVRAAGVEIWRYSDGFMHQKVLLIDDDIAGVGTQNLDNRSFRLNFETMALFFDREAAREIEAMLEVDFAEARLHDTPLSEQPLRLRAAAPLARLFAPIL